MHTGLLVAGVVAGVGLIAVTVSSALKTLVLPRSAPTILTRVVFVTLRSCFNLVTGPKRPYEHRDRRLAYFGPAGLLCLPVVWVALVTIGFTPLLYAAGVRPLSDAFLTSGSSVFTLGFERPESFVAEALCFAEAGFGLLLVALLVSYLPTIYAAFSRRETNVALLGTRAGTPPTPFMLIVRLHRLGVLEKMSELWPDWQTWFADVEETHSSIGALVFFRSPVADRSWVTAAGCILDSAALRASTLDLPRDPDAELCLRSGYLCLRSIADFYSLPHDPDPAPTDPISVSREEWDELVDRLAGEGVPVRPDRDAAWRSFAGWRVNYDAALLGLAGLTVAPEAPWVSDRHSGYRRPPLTRSVGKRRPRKA